MDSTWVSNVLAWIKQPIPYLLSFGFVLGLLIFGPGWIARDLGVNQVVSQYRWALGIGFIITFIAIMAALLSLAERHIIDYVSNRLWLRRKAKRMHDLTPQEKQILRVFFENNTRSCSLNVANGVVGGLVAEEIIYRSANISQGGTVFSHNIQPWAWDYLRKNPHLID